MELKLVQPFHHVCVRLGHEQELGAVLQAQSQHILLLRVARCDLAHRVQYGERRRRGNVLGVRCIRRTGRLGNIEEFLGCHTNSLEFTSLLLG